MGVSVADFVDVSSKPTVHLIAEDEIPELWEGEKGGRARLLAGSGGPDMTELWMWEMQPGKSLLHRATRKERLNCFMFSRARSHWG
jgi:hypothetical protein